MRAVDDFGPAHGPIDRDRIEIAVETLFDQHLGLLGSSLLQTAAKLSDVELVVLLKALRRAVPATLQEDTARFLRNKVEALPDWSGVPKVAALLAACETSIPECRPDHLRQQGRSGVKSYIGNIILIHTFYSWIQRVLVPFCRRKADSASAGPDMAPLWSQAIEVIDSLGAAALNAVEQGVTTVSAPICFNLWIC